MISTINKYSFFQSNIATPFALVNICASYYIAGDQRSLYLKCQGLRADLVRDHWEGLKFYNTTFDRVRSAGNSLNESTSVLRYVDVLYAGSFI